MFDYIFDAIGSLFEKIGDLIADFIDGILTLAEYVVDYFKGLKLRPDRDIPFIADEVQLADLIHRAPVKKVGIFEGVYNEDTNEIEHYRAIEADMMDSSLKKVLGNEPLVVLS